MIRPSTSVDSRARHLRRAAAGIAVLLLSAVASAPLFAHGDEDHSKDAKKAAPGATAAVAGAATAAPQGAVDREAPARLPDGSLFMPKHAQRQLGIRTQRTALADLAASIKLNGRVIAEPGAGGRVQATQPGTVQPVAAALPLPGRRVRQGETLALLQPTVGSLERAGQRAQQAELAAQLAIAQRRAERLQQLEGSVPAREIEAAQLERRGLQERLAAGATAVDVAQPLTAPVAGILSSVHVVAGEVVDARALLFEIVDPARLAVEALAYEPGLAARIASAEGLVGAKPLKLQLTGAGLQLREQALPLSFRIQGAPAGIAVGQPVQVIVRLRGGAPGIALPRSALARNAAGETVVWVHSDAERFEPRRVRSEPLDATRVAVSEGLKAGERVVVTGASLLAQVR